MIVHSTSLPGVLHFEPRVLRDERGHFLESWSSRRYAEAGIPAEFVQDNVSLSHHGVLRGLHYQEPNAQGKLVSVLDGEIWDVAVDIRRGSPTFAKWFGCTLSAEKGTQLYVPPGFAHGFAVTSLRAIVAYKCTDYYAPDSEATLRWDDPDLGIAWPVRTPVVSQKDGCGLSLKALLEGERLPSYWS